MTAPGVLGPWQHLLNPQDISPGGLEMGEGITNLLGDLRRIRRPGKQDDLSLGIKLLGRPYQMNEPLWRVILPTNTTDGLSSLKTSDDVCAWVGLEFLGIDAVLDHVHFVRIEIGIGVEDVFAHARTDGDHRIGGLEGSLLSP